MDKVDSLLEEGVPPAQLDVRPAPAPPTAQIAIQALFLLTLSALLDLFGHALVVLQLLAPDVSIVIS